MTDLSARLSAGVAIPAHPLALTPDGTLDERAQRALTRYYLDAGVDGLAVGVHTTQFELHEDREALVDVWRLAAETAAETGAGTAAEAEAAGTGSTSTGQTESSRVGSPPILIAGIVGDTTQAVAEAERAAALGYQAALLCPWGMADRSEDALLERARAVGEVLPTIGFYLQESVGGQRLSRDYWQRLFDLESVVAVKTAPFDRYRTNDVAQVLLAHERWDAVVLLTGNDDSIVHDLLTPTRGYGRELRVRGGLLGQWAVGARAAVDLVAQVRAAVDADSVPMDLLAQANALVQVNAAVFDVEHDFAGCVAGVNEVLRQQGLLTSARCLSDRERLSPGQADLIARVRADYPELLDEEFVAEHLQDWLR
ncbi:dihydrodipicolinate synthase family protein [Ruania halotolerans]|uniref:dihydrodipicolinate synthase family protein n=1 Tax=Ruania halotolerans TaxID=2897773 RepID=UPI001E4BC053|nr:dihydrodipicolinate synthase family protein [Ruania halotolerans]UFU05005.1 dihydrodipicolinate synthase family protein [Ruania halotolerans]